MSEQYNSAIMLVINF